VNTCYHNWWHAQWVLQHTGRQAQGAVWFQSYLRWVAHITGVDCLQSTCCGHIHVRMHTAQLLIWKLCGLNLLPYFPDFPHLTRDGMGQRKDDSCHFPFFVLKRYSVTGHRRSLRENFPVATIEATITGDIIDSIVSLLHFKVKVTSSGQRTRYQLTTPNGTLPLSNEHPGNHTLVRTQISADQTPCTCRAHTLHVRFDQWIEDKLTTRTRTHAPKNSN